MISIKVPVNWLFTCLITFSLLVYTGYSIKCFICNSRTDPKCGDPFVNESIPLNDCDSDPHKPSTPNLKDMKAKMCRKVRQKVENEWRVIRSCAYLGSPGEGSGNENVCQYQTESFNVFQEVCTCNSKDGCNHGSSKSLNSFLITTSIFIFILFAALN